MTKQPSRSKSRGFRSSRTRKDALVGILFVGPDVLGLLVFVVAPIMFAVYMSFYKWDMITAPEFIGVSNYKQMWNDGTWWASLRRTVVLALQYVPALFIVALTLAATLNYLGKRVAGFIKTAILLPFSVTSVIAATLWMFLYNEKRGYINTVLGWIGIPPQPFIGSQSQALSAVVFVLFWINLGYNTILFNSAIKNVPAELYEAAGLDGASKVRQFFSITIPLIKRTSIFILVTTTIAAFQIMDIILVMTKGGPASATQVGVLYIYDRSFNMLQMGYGSALSVFLFVVLLMLSVFQMKITNRKNEDD